MRTQLKKLTMYNKVNELSREGLSIRQISRNTGLDRATVRKYLRMTEEEFSASLALQKQRNRKLQPYEEFIKQRVTNYPDCSAAQGEDCGLLLLSQGASVFRLPFQRQYLQG